MKECESENMKTEYESQHAMQNESTHIVAAIVENRPGVLHSVSNLFRRRGFNIESISIGQLQQEDLARMTIAVKGDEKTLEQVVKQLEKLIGTVEVSKLSPYSTVAREMILVKIEAPSPKDGSDLMTYMEAFGGRIVDVSSDTLVIELSGESGRIDAFLELLKSHHIKELARTGVAALSRGNLCLNSGEMCGGNGY